jgi:hypothetical protein
MFASHPRSQTGRPLPGLVAFRPCHLGFGVGINSLRVPLALCLHRINHSPQSRVNAHDSPFCTLPYVKLLLLQRPLPEFPDLGLGVV